MEMEVYPLTLSDCGIIMAANAVCLGIRAIGIAYHPSRNLWSQLSHQTQHRFLSGIRGVHDHPVLRSDLR